MKLLTKILAVVFCMALSFSAVSAQETTEDGKTDKAKEISGLKKLDFLLGTWKGKGWIMTRNGRQTFTITETVQPKLGGQLYVVEGLGKSVDKDTGKERIIHQAYGIFSYDKEADKIKFRWYKADTGEEGLTDIEVSDNKFSWEFDVPENKVRVKFTEVINEKGNWLEVGEVSRDGGKNWFKFFEMELSKVSE